MKLSLKLIVTMALLLGATVHVQKAVAQDVAQTYRMAAKAYRDAAAKSAADKKDCYNQWAGYYDCLADSMQSGSNLRCSQPPCTAGQ
jgi:hypothetical protein